MDSEDFPQVHWRESGEELTARWRSEAGSPAPQAVAVVGDTTRADVAIKRLRAGEALLYAGDFRNARQLLSSVERRLSNPARKANPAPNLREAFHRGRARKASEHAVLSHLLVSLDPEYRLRLQHAPDVSQACRHAWGESGGLRTVVSLRELLGVIGAEEWRRVGLEIPGLPARIHPHYGVFTPTRGDYPALIAKAPSPAGKRVFDIGTGTGVLGFLLLARGAQSVVATDLEPRAIACATENAERLGFQDHFRAELGDLFPEGTADLIICNPPWVPAAARTPMDRAIYDPEQRFLKAFLSGLASHLTPGGEGWLIVSDLPERLGLREPGALEAMIAQAQLEIVDRQEVAPTHPRTRDEDDPLHEARAAEMTRLWRLRARG